MNKDANIIFRTLVGSRTYGTFGENSDYDYKGIFIVDKDKYFNPFVDISVIQNSDDDSLWELDKFANLLNKSTPNAIELLWMPDKFFVECNPLFEPFIERKEKFLSKKCYYTFASYATAQIRKCKGQNKKTNWENDKKTRKNPIEFCYVLSDNKQTKKLKDFLLENDINQENCAVTKISNFKDSYLIYFRKDKNKGLQFRGIFSEKSNDIRLSSIPKSELDECDSFVIYFNKDGYTQHCKDYLEYLEWKENRNKQRYLDYMGHEQGYDGKNISHCFRLLTMAEEIAKYQQVIIERPEAEFLKQIRKGQVDLKEIIKQAELKQDNLKKLFDKSNLQENIDEKLLTNMVINTRKKMYGY